MSGQASSGSPLFRRRMYLVWWIWILVAIPVVLFIVVVAGGIANNRTSYSIWFGVLAGILVALVANFGSLVFEVNEDEVVVRFGVLKWRYRRADILSCEPYELKFSNYWGYGIRYGADGTKAINTRSGPGIKMQIEGQKRAVVVSVDDPEQACRAVMGFSG